MTYQKRFSSFQNRPNVNSVSPVPKQQAKKKHAIVDPTFKVFGNRLPEYYSGHPSRIVRYNQYEMMDNDAEVNACLDIIAEFSTQVSPQTKTPFVVNYANDPTPHEVEIITKQLQQWCKLNDFNTRLFKIFRNCLKYGDQVFIRDPENFKLYWVDMVKVIKVIVNEATGKTPEQYVIQDLNPNFENLTAASKTNLDFRSNPSTAGYSAPFAYTVPNSGQTTTGSRFSQSIQEFPLDAKHIVHLSLTEGLDRNWPFGQSILESIFKVYKQKELLEDAILIYRVQRAPERRVFKIDVGNMPSHMAMAFVNKVKDEIHQRRIPSINNQNNANGSLVDSTYNAMHQLEDFFFPQSCISLDTKIPLLDGRTLTLSELIAEYEQGKQNYVYSINQQTFKMEPGKILWAGVTRKQAKVLEVELDNGEKVKVTLDHRFIMRDGSEKHAELLQVGDSIMPRNSQLIVKVNKVIELLEVEDTGDLTIEVNHNFALSAGVYVHNSDGRGSSVEVLPGGCFAMDTLVPLLDGRELTIAQISDELQTGKQLWAYSCEPKTGKIVPGLISWAGMTQKSAKVMKFTLDNGKTFICTPEHKFPVYDSEFKRADEFKVGDSFIPLYRRKKARASNSSEYEQVFDNSSKTWKFTHWVVADELKDTVVNYHIHDETISNGLYEVRHHVNFDRFDNSPNNLVWMSILDHLKLHGDLSAARLNSMKEKSPVEYDNYCKKLSDSGKSVWDSLTDEQKLKIKTRLLSTNWGCLTPKQHVARTQLLSKKLKASIAALSPEEREKRAENSRKAFKLANVAFNEKMNSDPEFYEYVVSKRMEYWTPENREARGKQFKSIREQYTKTEKYQRELDAFVKNQSITFTHEMLITVIDAVKNGKTAIQIAELLNNSEHRDVLTELNKDKKIKNWKIEDGFTEGNIRRSLIKQFGFSSWKIFKQQYKNHNHRVVKIEYLDEEIPVGTLTIDQDEIYHGYHTFAISAGVMTKNSALGEISDLRYFDNKMARGLRVPSSYMPTGPEDSPNAFNDGKVGTALIQELRFNQYCQRLQRYICEKLDIEFKTFLKWRGFNIDASLFDIEFCPPQNFAAYRMVELDTARSAVFTSMEALPYMSKRFAMERFLGLTEEEIKRNEKLWTEEHSKPEDTQIKGSDLRNIGISTGDIESDQETGDMAETGEDAMGELEETPPEE